MAALDKVIVDFKATLWRYAEDSTKTESTIEICFRNCY